MVLVDHGIFRLALNRRTPVAPGVWRSSQPWPHQLRAAARDGVRAVVNLRGRRRCGAYHLEIRTCRELGLELLDFPIGSREAPWPSRVLGALDLFRRLDGTPFLMHCKSGADRVGLMSALYLAGHLGRPLEEAMGQLSLRFGHVRQAKTGILDAFFVAWDRAGRPDLRAWVAEGYDPAALTASFRAGRLADGLVDRVLRRE